MSRHLLLLFRKRTGTRVCNVNPAIISQGFNSSTPPNTYPAGWTADDSGFFLLDAGDPDVFDCDLPDSSGGIKVAAFDPVDPAEMSSPSFSTVGYCNVYVTWNALRSMSNTITLSLAYSIDGGSTKVDVPYINVDDDYVWHPVSPIKLPDEAIGHAGVILYWTTQGDGSGSFQGIDDIKVYAV